MSPESYYPTAAGLYQVTMGTIIAFNVTTNTSKLYPMLKCGCCLRTASSQVHPDVALAENQQVNVASVVQSEQNGLRKGFFNTQSTEQSLSYLLFRNAQ